MCIICVSKSGIRQPDEATITRMFHRNPHGAGYMYARDGKVVIRKGFMNLEDYLAAVSAEEFTAADSVVYHFRISTQAGINPEMTHPFPLTNHRKALTALDVVCPIGIAHNGTIRLTSDPDNKRYSDTALFIASYMTKLIKKPADIRNDDVLQQIEYLARSKFAIMDESGYVATIGEFTNVRGLLFSNDSYLPHRRYYY